MFLVAGTCSDAHGVDTVRSTARRYPHTPWQLCGHAPVPSVRVIGHRESLPLHAGRVNGPEMLQRILLELRADAPFTRFLVISASYLMNRHFNFRHRAGHRSRGMN